MDLSNRYATFEVASQAHTAMSYSEVSDGPIDHQKIVLGTGGGDQYPRHQIVNQDYGEASPSEFQGQSYGGYSEVFGVLQESGGSMSRRPERWFTEEELSTLLFSQEVEVVVTDGESERKKNESGKNYKPKVSPVGHPEEITEKSLDGVCAEISTLVGTKEESEERHRKKKSSEQPKKLPERRVDVEGLWKPREGWKVGWKKSIASKKAHGMLWQNCSMIQSVIQTYLNGGADDMKCPIVGCSRVYLVPNSFRNHLNNKHTGFIDECKHCKKLFDCRVRVDKIVAYFSKTCVYCQRNNL